MSLPLSTRKEFWNFFALKRIAKERIRISIISYGIYDSNAVKSLNSSVIYVIKKCGIGRRSRTIWFSCTRWGYLMIQADIKWLRWVYCGGEGMACSGHNGWGVWSMLPYRRLLMFSWRLLWGCLLNWLPTFSSTLMVLCKIVIKYDGIS